MTHDTNFVFFGSPEFAAIILKELIGAGFVPAAVICNPDRPVGRKKVVTPPPVKQFIASCEPRAAILQPEKLNADDLRHTIGDLRVEFAVVAAYAKIIPKEILDHFPRGVIGVHPSLLPKYRGASPIQSAILNGDNETGVTLYLLDEKMDRGKIVSSVECQVSSEDNCATLMKKLAKLGGGLLVETLPKFIAGEIKPQPQNESLATYTKKFSTEDAFVEEENLEKALAGDKNYSEIIDRKIRALNPEPGVWTMQNGKRTKLLEAVVRGGALFLKKIQIAGEKARGL